MGGKRATEICCLPFLPCCLRVVDDSWMEFPCSSDCGNVRSARFPSVLSLATSSSGTHTRIHINTCVICTVGLLCPNVFYFSGADKELHLPWSLMPCTCLLILKVLARPLPHALPHRRQLGRQPCCQPPHCYFFFDSFLLNKTYCLVTFVYSSMLHLSLRRNSAFLHSFVVQALIITLFSSREQECQRKVQVFQREETKILCLWNWNEIIWSFICKKRNNVSRQRIQRIKVDNPTSFLHLIPPSLLVNAHW